MSHNFSPLQCVGKRHLLARDWGSFLAAFVAAAARRPPVYCIDVGMSGGGKPQILEIVDDEVVRILQLTSRCGACRYSRIESVLSAPCTCRARFSGSAHVLYQDRTRTKMSHVRGGGDQKRPKKT